MSTTETSRTAEIAKLNDTLRQFFCIGRVVQTLGISALDADTQSAIREKVVAYDDFTRDNDPYGERDYGAFDHDGHKICWKIDYYALDMLHASEDPADRRKTVRVLTIMLERER
ncbi:DUF3768 domain-containing protein [Martelella sp. HB161492]|uniref:DUF3768 domain-containing protein n=1 Tax=Martelella sp. HB161492 TaxID=2720726 RepID=UPI0015927B45|nr:DUF3768 domain-containing protein [Martelella sp. HB161492]